MRTGIKVAGGGMVACLGVGAWYYTQQEDSVFPGVDSNGDTSVVTEPFDHVLEPDREHTAEAVLARAVTLTKSETSRSEGEALLRTLTQVDIPTDVRSQAFRLLAQLEVAGGDHAGAISDLEYVLALIDAGEAGFGPSAASEASAMNQLMMLRLRTDDVAGALEANAAASRLPDGSLPRDSRARILYHQAMLTHRSGRLSEALEHIRIATAFASQHGLDDTLVRSRILEASILSEQRDWPAAVDVLRLVWDRTVEPSYANRAPVIALELVSALQQAGNSVDAVTVSRHAVERLRTQATPRDVAGNRRVRVTLLSGMLAADLVGLPDDALWALDQLEALVAADAGAAETLATQRQALYERLSRPQVP